ncbi:uncharacterized protein LOC123697328 [Colias croceus]|uniref:uncharacterized protein LOC123697328 n=1 Tax=Colias crocea TaxID=72248 RepID=UPI001E280CFA|nr:uncharacterized protein LOC123697328 [Colias croceus]
MVFEIPELGRCCFCMPLRRGIATYGYVNIVWSAIMILLLAHYNPFLEFAFLYSNLLLNVGWEASIALYSIDIVVSLVLVVGAHLKHVKLLKAYICYVLFSLLVLLILNLAEFYKTNYILMEISSLIGFIISACIHSYTLILVQSLIKKIETATPADGYQNQLNQFVTLEDGEINVKENDSVAIPVET